MWWEFNVNCKYRPANDAVKVAILTSMIVIGGWRDIVSVSVRNLNHSVNCWLRHDRDCDFELTCPFALGEESVCVLLVEVR